MTTGYILLSLTGFLRILLIILCVYYGIKLLSRWLMPIILNKAAEKFADRMQNGQGFGQPQKPKRPEGDVVVEGKKKSTKPKNTSNQDQGDYVDFEEID